MELTTALAQLWGPVILLVGIGMFVSRSYYVRVYRDLEKDALAVLVFGMVAVVTGIIHVSVHSVWGTFDEILISLLGWGLLLKGAVFLALPRLVDMRGDMIVKLKLVPIIGVLMLVIGAYLSWIGYFA